MPSYLVLFVAFASMLRLRSTESFSMPTPPRPSPSSSSAAPPSSPPSRYDFNSFEFDPSTGICRRPSSFRYDPGPGDGDGDGDETRYFVMRNVPGDGDCVFHAVLGSVFVSMGMINPDAAYSDNVLHSMALEMRRVVANFLSSPEGTLYVNNRPRKRIVRCRDLLQSAAKNEGLSAEEYLAKLRQPGRQGGLYGGGPELTVLSNILRRPISIFHIKQCTMANSTEDNCCELQRMGVFGEGIFEDSCRSVPDSVVYNAVFFTLDARARQRAEQQTSPISSPLKCSWHLHILIADSDEGEKHACILLPSVPILHNDR